MFWYIKSVTYTPKVGKRLMARVQKSALHAMAKHWHANIRPKHFKMAASEEYGYRKRSRYYEYDKRRKTHRNRPLVWSGESERKSETDYRITGTSKRVRLRMNVPTLNLTRRSVRGDSGKTMREELTAVSQRDLDSMLKLFAKEIERGLKREKSKSRPVTVNVVVG